MVLLPPRRGREKLAEDKPKIGSPLESEPWASDPRANFLHPFRGVRDYPPGMDLIVPADVQCPTCGEWLTVELDTSQGEDFETVQDCEVCCRPMLLRVRCSPGQVDDVESESA